MTTFVCILLAFILGMWLEKIGDWLVNRSKPSGRPVLIEPPDDDDDTQELCVRTLTGDASRHCDCENCRAEREYEVEKACRYFYEG